MPAALLQPTLEHLGLVRGLPLPAYHAGPGLGHSQLVEFARSPARYFALYRDARRPEAIPTKPQTLGSLAHTMVLEPGEFPLRYIVGPGESRRTAAWHAFEADHPGRTVIKASELEAAQDQARALRADPDIAKLLSVGEAEVSAYWRDADTGLLCRCRPDWVHPAGHGVVLVDVKTCPDVSTFETSIGTYRYHWQAHYYTQGYSIASERPVIGFAFVCVESTYPFGVLATMLDAKSMGIAEAEVTDALARFARCEAEGAWPGVASGLTTSSLPRWYRPTVGTHAL